MKVQYAIHYGKHVIFFIYIAAAPYMDSYPDLYNNSMRFFYYNSHSGSEHRNLGPVQLCRTI
jgi:hypothetical protein